MKMLSCHKGLAPISFPDSWLEGFDMKCSFAAAGGEGFIRFPSGRAWGVSVSQAVDGPRAAVRALGDAEIARLSWGPFCPPWESYSTARVFGHGHVTALPLCPEYGGVASPDAEVGRSACA